MGWVALQASCFAFGCGAGGEPHDGASTSTQQEPCIPAFVGFAIEVCGTPSTVVELRGSGEACHDAFLRCDTEKCDRWFIDAKRAGDCELTVTVDSVDYVLHLPIMQVPDLCYGGYMYKPACGVDSFDVGPECPLPVCTAP